MGRVISEGQHDRNRIPSPRQLRVIELVGVGTLDCFRTMKVPIRLLAGAHNNSIEAGFENALRAFPAEGFTIEVRRHPKLHDRHIAFNERCWLLGSSLKDAGKKALHDGDRRRQGRGRRRTRSEAERGVALSLIPEADEPKHPILWHTFCTSFSRNMEKIHCVRLLECQSESLPTSRLMASLAVRGSTSGLLVIQSQRGSGISNIRQALYNTVIVLVESRVLVAR